MIYGILFIVLAFFALFDVLRGGGKIKKIIFCFLVIVLIVLSAIRWNVGTDWVSYLDFYESVSSYVLNPELNMMERGFTYLNYGLSQLGLNYSGYLAVVALLTIGIKAKVFYEHRSTMMMCLFLYFCYYFADLFAVRQFLAISITLYATKYIRERTLLKFIILVLIASSIHISSILFLAAYRIYHIKFSPILLYSTLLIAFVMGFFDVAGLLAKFVINFVGIDSRVGDKLMFYEEEGLDTATAGNPYIAFAVGVLKRAVFLPIFIYCKRFVSEKDQANYVGYLNLLVFGNLIYLVVMISLPVIARVTTGFLIYEIFVISYLVISIKNKWYRVLGLLLVILFGAFRLYNLIAVYWDLYIPFETIFSPSSFQRE